MQLNTLKYAFKIHIVTELIYIQDQFFHITLLLEIK